MHVSVCILEFYMHFYAVKVNICSLTASYNYCCLFAPLSSWLVLKQILLGRFYTHSLLIVNILYRLNVCHMMDVGMDTDFSLRNAKDPGMM